MVRTRYDEGIRLIIKNIIDEDFTNYKLPSMFIGTSKCDWKCCKEQNLPINTCQNSALAQSNNIDIPISEIYDRYVSNKISKAIVIGGLEPMLQFNDIHKLIFYFRKKLNYDPFIIYTGYYKNELTKEILSLVNLKNITIKFGRYIPNQEKHFDEVLGVYLASSNQYAEKIC